MDCLRVDISRIIGDVSIKVLSLCDIIVNAVSSAFDDLRVIACSKNVYDVNVAVSSLCDDFSASASDVVGAVSVRAYVVCGSNLSDEYYLLVEEGYTLTIDDEYITVLRNA